MFKMCSATIFFLIHVCVSFQMALLMNGVYCRKKVWISALGNSKAVTHLARRLIVGVFKEEKLLQCTFTGQAPRAQGKERQKETVECLDLRARNAIIG